MKDGLKPDVAFHTVGHIAEILDLSERTVHRLINTGRLPAHKFGHSVRVASRDLTTYVQQSRK